MSPLASMAVFEHPRKTGQQVVDRVLRGADFSYDVSHPQSTDRHNGIVGQECCYFQRDL